MPVSRPGDGQERQSASPLRFAAVGFELVLPVVLLMWAGRWLDSRWETAPWLLISGAGLGFVVGFYTLFKRVVGLGKPRSDR